MKNPILVPTIRELINSENLSAIHEFCESCHPAEVAELISPLAPEEVWVVLNTLDLSLRAEIFSHLEGEFQVEVISTLRRADAVPLITEMPPDDRADLFKRMPEEKRERLMPALAQAEREDIRRLTAYEEGTAGAVMTSDYAFLTPDLTASEAVERLRQVAPDKETIYYAYVVDEKRKLMGFVSLKDLILAQRDVRIADIMNEDVIFARVKDDQEDAARKIQKYDLIALPVINGGDALVGIITHDDAIDIITQEQTEDMEKFMAIAGSHESVGYLRISAWSHFKNRSIWVVVLAGLGLVSGFIVQNYQGLLLQFAILAAFMPMLAASGGNTGSQSATLVIRALALKEISFRDIFRILAKETQVALMLGILLGLLAYGRVMIFGDKDILPHGASLSMIGLAVGAALSLQVISATLIGAVLPMIVARFKLDPALVASPALSSMVDITGLLIFFSMAKLVLSL
jgi:magnesium transporter